MEFQYAGDKMKLQGKIMTGSAPLTCKMLNKLVAEHSIAFLYQLQVVVDQPKTENLPKEVLTVLHTYTDIFSTPTTLPPPREVDHRILIIPGAKPINV